MFGLSAVIGYAIGTLQILLIDWWRRVAAHRRHLCLLQAELRRLRTFEPKFEWVDGIPPEDEKVPRPPQETELFVRTVGETDWRLSDEIENDNTQQALLHILDGCWTLRLYASEVMAAVDQSRLEKDGEERLKLLFRAAAYAKAYDGEVDGVLYLVDDALRDLERRLALATLGEQLGRAFNTLPRGQNPTLFQKNDPKFLEWKRRRAGSLANGDW